MANDSAVNDPPPIVKGRGEKMPEQWKERRRDGINFPGEREGERRNGIPLTPSIGSNCISTPGKREVLQRWAQRVIGERERDEEDTKKETRSIVNLNEICTSRS